MWKSGLGKLSLPARCIGMLAWVFYYYSVYRFSIFCLCFWNGNYEVAPQQCLHDTCFENSPDVPAWGINPSLPKPYSIWHISLCIISISAHLWEHSHSNFLKVSIQITRLTPAYENHEKWPIEKLMTIQVLHIVCRVFFPIHFEYPFPFLLGAHYFFLSKTTSLRATSIFILQYFHTFSYFCTNLYRNSLGVYPFLIYP